MNRFKRILSVLALICMGVFVVAVLALLLMGRLSEFPLWIYGPMSGFLMFGLTALLIHKLQQLAEEKREKEE